LRSEWGFVRVSGLTGQEEGLQVLLTEAALSLAILFLLSLLLCRIYHTALAKAIGAAMLTYFLALQIFCHPQC
jgi:hypothetical protein